MKKMSIKQMAKDLNISTAAISYIINGKAKEKRISEDLELRVMKYVKEHNYIPNQLASSLRSGKTKTICLMVEDIADVFFARIAGSIEQIAFDKGYKIVYCSTNNDDEKAKEQINRLLSRSVDGYIITPTSNINKEIQSLIDEKIPVVVFDRYLDDVDSSYVGIDNLESSYKATMHLLEQGFQNIAFITSGSNQSQMIQRLVGYEKALNENGKKPLVEKIENSTRDEEVEINKITEFLLSNPAIDALFFSTNYLAISGLQAIAKAGRKLGENIGMVVFEENDLFKVHVPSITVVAQPIVSMSTQLMQVLLSHLEDVKVYIPQKHIIPGELIIRESSKKK